MQPSHEATLSLRVEGRELAIFRFDGDRIAEVWFYNEPANPEAFSAVFAFD